MCQCTTRLRAREPSVPLPSVSVPVVRHGDLDSDGTAMMMPVVNLPTYLPMFHCFSSSISFRVIYAMQLTVFLSNSSTASATGSGRRSRCCQCPGSVAILVDELELNEDFKLEESSCHAKLEVRLGYILKTAQFNDTLLIEIIRKITLGRELEIITSPPKDSEFFIVEVTSR